MCCIMLIYLHMLKYPYNPSYLDIQGGSRWIQLDHGVWSFLYVVGVSLLIFCWGFLHLYSSKILACNFLFFVLVWFWYQGDGGFIVWLWEFSPIFNLLEEFEKDRYKFFVCWVEFPSEAIWSCFQGVLKLQITFLFWWSVCWNYVFFLIQFWQVACF